MIPHPDSLAGRVAAQRRQRAEAADRRADLHGEGPHADAYRVEAEQWRHGVVRALCGDLAPLPTPLGPRDLSPAASAVLEWARAHSDTRPEGRVVGWNWGLAADASGLPAVLDHHGARNAFATVSPALEELHAAGELGTHDYGPATYGHTSTILIRRA